jgi:membrane-associated phospholipid phosphatase
MAESFDKKPVENAQEAVREQTALPSVRRWRVILFQGALIVAVSFFAVLALLARTNAYFPIDVSITKALQTLHAPWFDALMHFMSTLGYFPESLIISGAFLGLLYYLGFHWETLMLFVSIVSISLLNNAVKYFVHRPRPPSSLVEVFQVLNSYSFPSGHVMYYVSLYGFLLFLTFALLKRSWYRTVLVTVFALIILLIGPSRIYLGEHWASDVVGAYLLGYLGLAGVIAVYRWGKGRFMVRQPVAPEPIEPDAKPIGTSVPVTSRDATPKTGGDRRK